MDYQKDEGTYADLIRFPNIGGETQVERIKELLLGLAEETGELIQIHNKWFRTKLHVKREHLIEELGDVLAYWENIRQFWTIDTTTVLQRSVDKIRLRHPERFIDKKELK